MATYIRSKSGKIVPQRADLAQRHLGIIAQRAIFWHRTLPDSVKIYYDVEDMIGEVVLHVIKRSHLHNIARGKESTFVWHTADNRCMSILMHYKTKQFTACGTVELTPELMKSTSIPNTQSDIEFSNSLNAVERVIEFASDRLLTLIEQIFTGTVELQNFRSSSTYTNDTFEEFKKIAASQSATLEDFLRVYKYVQC